MLMVPNIGILMESSMDGPAIEYADGRKEWYINGEVVPENMKFLINKIKELIKTN